MATGLSASIRRLRTVGGYGVIAATVLCAMPASAQTAASTPARVADGFVFAAAGDMIGPYQPVLPYRDSGLDAVAKLVRSADAAFANLEGNVFDLATFTGSPAAQNGGGTPLGDAAVAGDLKAFGIDLVSRANNHATDYGLDGLLETSRVLDAAGVIHAGSGPSLAVARAPAYFVTPKGKVALVAAASSFTDMSVAADPGAKTRARAGLSPLRTRAVTLVSEPEMATLRGIAARQSGAREAGAMSAAPTRDVSIGRAAFRVSPTLGQTYDLNAADRQAVVQSVREARQAADLVVFSIHAHETASGSSEDPAPADFLPPLFHELIDNGADMVVRHGPHALQGIEIYKGKPIFYGMASLFFGVGDKDRRFGTGPSSWRMSDRWYESAIATSEYQGGQVRTIRIHPIVMSFDDSRMLGSPRIAPADVAKAILERVRDMSARFGTTVRIENGIGIITLPRTR